MTNLQIAVDGPAGSGKSTVAKKIAEQLRITYLDTGAMYRAVTYKALEAEIDLNDQAALKAVVDQMTICFNQNSIIVDGLDVSEAIRTQRVTLNVSLVSADAYVRSEMVKRQQAIANGQSVIMDGRDIGTTVLPNASYKFFLVADPRERARRRLAELSAKGFTGDLDEIVADIIRRDTFDSNREVSPLKKAEDAIEIDTTDLTIEEVIEVILKAVRS
ncbi:MAG: cytidylate kinase [Clostridiales bacterium 38-18]|nr:MAG: cytidylate kinase [Clostridiales bacterium 38-18]